MFLPTVVMLVNLARMTFVPTRDARALGACMILLMTVVLQRHLDRWLKQSRKGLDMLALFNYSAVKWNSQGAVAG